MTLVEMSATFPMGSTITLGDTVWTVVGHHPGSERILLEAGPTGHRTTTLRNVEGLT